MAGSLNKVMLIGNLGADPEVKSFQNGGRICNLRIATSENWKDKNTGERKERTEWHTVVLQSDGLVGVDLLVGRPVVVLPVPDVPVRAMAGAEQAERTVPHELA